MKKSRKIIAILLTVLTLMSVISAATPVFAAEVTEITESTEATLEAADTTEVEKSENATDESEEDEPEILNEMVEWRTESTKYFRNSDGSYTAAQYAFPVHYKENGEWKEIDNTLTEEIVDSSVTDTKKAFVADNTNTPACFPENLGKDGNGEISITAEGHKISFSPKGTKNDIKESKGKVKDREDLDSVKIVDIATEKQEVSTFKLKPNSEKSNKKEHKKNEKFRVENKSSAIVYENVYDNVDLEYELNNSKLKESIVLNEKQSDYTFNFNMDLDGLFPIICEDGSINLCSDKEGINPIAKIETPYMLDSLGEYSDAVTMTIEQHKKEYVLTIIADENWINDEKREFPVIIDPTIDLQINRLNTIDCYVDNSQPSTSFPEDYYIYAGHSSYGKTRTFIKFKLPELPDDNCIITNAFIEFWQKSADVSSATSYLNLYEVTTAWSNDTASARPTWNKQPQDSGIVLDYAEIKFGEDIAYYFDITRTVKEWYETNKLETNYGFLLKSSDESVVNRVQLYSAENSREGAYPAIYVDFRNNKGLEGYWSYSSFGVGVAGTAHINDYTGNLVYQLPIASSISEIMPISIEGYYNNYCANELVSETEAENVRTSIGRGFRLNYQQTVLPSTDYGLTGENANKYPYVYTDGDGTEHYIQKVIEKEKNDDGEEVEKTVYKDEDGLGLTLTTGVDENDKKYYKIEDKAHNIYYFNFRGNLSRIKDNNGNEIKILYKAADATSNLLDRSRIDKIIDGAGHTYTFAYAKKSSGVETDYVKTITDDAGRVVDFDISSGLLTDVKYPNKDTAFISYNISSASGDSEGRINAITSNGNYCLNFDYTSKATGRRVNLVKEYGVTYNSNKEKVYHLGQVISFDRSKYNTTVMRSCGLDCVHGNDNDIITTVQYDNMGRAISQQMKFGSGDEIGAGSCAYTTSDSDETASGFKNKVSGSGATGKYVENLLYGGNAESNSHWSFDTAGSVEARQDISTASKYIGTKSLKLTITEVTGENGRCYYRQNFTSNVKPDTHYTLSAYVKVGDLVAYPKGDLKGAFIQIIGYDAQGNAVSTVNSRSQIITERSNLDVNNGWRRLSCTVKTDSTVKELRCYLFLRNAEGSVCFDGIQLEKGETANDYNMLENSHFTEKSSGNKPKAWEKADQMVFETNTNGVIETSELPNEDYYKDIKSKTLIITGSPNSEKGVSQTVEVDGNPDDTYILSGWAKGFPVNTTYHTELTKGKDTETTDDDEYSGTALFEIAVKVKYSVSDGSDPVEELKTPASFNTTITDWQCASVPISLKYSKAKKDVTYTPESITIIPRYNNQENFAFFDKIMLVKDAASSYTYDKDGNLVSASSNSEQKNSMEYDDNNNLTSYKDTAGFTTKLSYDNNNVTLVESDKGVFTDYDYSSQGNVTNTETRNKKESSDATGVIRTTKRYNDTKTEDNVTINKGAYNTESRDQNGNLTSYEQDHETGMLMSVTNAKNVVTNYEYYPTTNNIAFGKQKSVATGNSKVTYNYNKDTQRLSSIVFGSTKQETYSFEYDEFGNVTKTKVGSQALSTNAFDNNNGALKKTTYGNTDYRRFSYNKFGQKMVDYVSDNGTEIKAYSWAYNDSGVNIRHTDYVNGLQYLFDYDSLGRLSKEEAKDRISGAFVGYTEYGYDVRNNLTNLITNYGGKSHNQQYFYSEVSQNSNSGSYEKDNLPTMYKLDDSRYATYSYDSLNRLNQRQLALGGNTNLYYNYIYKSSDRNTTDETIFRTTQISKEFIGNDVFIYSYDDLGNITSIKKATRSGSATSTSYTGTTDYAAYGYDDLGQLTRENIAGKYTYAWSYDELGNIAAKNEYAYTTDVDLAGKILTKTVTYYYKEDDIPYEIEPETTKTYSSWNNLLLAVDLDGSNKVDNDEIIEYDEIGNPTTYLGTSLTWNGRQLTSYKTSDKEISYTYGSNGLRTSKTIKNGVKSEYFYVNGQLHYEERSNGTKLYFFYDSNGYLTGIEYNNTMYYPTTNQRGDVVAIYNNLGNCIVRYEYDAWGKVIAVTDANDVEITDQTHIAHINPIRYRGYYYDSETKWYYLQSRYYNPEVGRFLNSDSISDSGAGVLGFNTFIYCANNPVNASDPSGHFGLFGAIIATGAIVGGLLGALSAASTGGNVIESTIEGMLTGALSATCGLMISNPIVAIGVATVGGAGIDFATQVTTQSIKNKEVDFSNVDYGRVAKTGAQTGLGTAVPKIGNATGNVADAVGTALLWAEASTLISCSDIIITNTVKSISMGVSKEQEKEECETKEIVLMLE